VLLFENLRSPRLSDVDLLGELNEDPTACVYAKYVGEGHLISRGRVKDDVQRVRGNAVVALLSWLVLGFFLGIVALKAAASHEVTGGRVLSRRSDRVMKIRRGASAKPSVNSGER
jgi:hypothetical protein